MTLSPKDAERALLARYGAPAKPATDKVTGFKTGAGRVLAIDTRGKETRIWFRPPAPPPMRAISVLPDPNNGNHHINGPLAPLRLPDTQRVEIDSPSALQRFLDWHDGSLAISYTSARFPSSYGVGSGTLRFSWDDLLWAAITIGRPNTAYVFRHGVASIHEALFRLSLMRMALEQVSFGGHLHRTDAFRALDPTEKGAVSYFLGMVVCKLFASRLLSTPWLLHLDVFRDQLDPATLGGRSRPDLVGQDASGAWHAFETKGRSSVPSSEDKQKAKAQAQRLVSVDGSACSLHIGSFAFFRGDELEFYWRDPEPEEPEDLEPLRVEVRDEDWANYYQPALSMALEGESSALSARAQQPDLHVEVHPKLRDLLFEGQWAAARSLVAELRQMLEAEGFQPDGLRVVAGDSWRRSFKGAEG